MCLRSWKLFGERNPPQSWPWKQNCTTVVAVVINLEVVEQLKKQVTDKYIEKIDFESESPSVRGKYVAITIEQ